MRDFDFVVRFTQSKNNTFRIVLFVGPSHTAEEFIRDDFIVRPVKTLVDLLAFWRGFDSKFHVSAIGPDRLALDMSSELIDSPWMIGSLLGVIDAATWLQDIDDDPFVMAVTVSSSFESVQDIGAVFSDMQRFADECGARLSTGISPDSTDEGERINIWPSDASNYFFDLTFSMLEPLEAQNFARLNQSYKHIDATLAETAYEPEMSAGMGPPRTGIGLGTGRLRCL